MGSHGLSAPLTHFKYGKLLINLLSEIMQPLFFSGYHVKVELIEQQSETHQVSNCRGIDSGGSGWHSKALREMKTERKFGFVLRLCSDRDENLVEDRDQQKSQSPDADRDGDLRCGGDIIRERFQRLRDEACDYEAQALLDPERQENEAASRQRQPVFQFDVLRKTVWRCRRR